MSGEGESGPGERRLPAKETAGPKALKQSYACQDEWGVARKTPGAERVREGW